MAGRTTVSIGDVFGELAASSRWLAWREEVRGGKRRKVPYAPGGGLASSTDPATWGTLEDATRARDERGLDGVGIVLGDGLGGVDLDACRDPGTGELTPWARRLIDGFRTYSEISPSGTGVKVFAFGAPGELPCSTLPMKGPKINGKRPAIEAYVAGRYFTVTGRIVDGVPDDVEDCGELGGPWDRLRYSLEKYAARNGAGGGPAAAAPTGATEIPDRLKGALEGTGKAARLWRRGTANGTDRSRNDAALAGTLGALGFADPAIEAAIRAYPLGQLGQGALTGAAAERQVARLLAIATKARNGRGAEPGRRDLSHDGLALDLGDSWDGQARHVAAWGRWYFWDGAIWREDERLEHMTRARAFLRGLADKLGDEKPAKRLRQAETVAKVVSLARSNVAQAAAVGEWDRDPWLLGTPGGTVDLRTGELRDADPADRITKATAVAPAPPGTPCPLWRAFLEEITAGDEALQAYLRRFFGYALTGSIREHVFMFGHGTGANGKGVTVNTIAGLMGDYALAIPTEMLMVSQTERHPTELARLRGVRLAVGSETEQGKRWAEAKIKALTGGDTIAARFMRRDFFEFDPTFKLVVVGNHRPSLRGVDEAMRRRLHFVRFPVKIPPERRNKELERDLEPEWPAILRWAIDGCLEWQEHGLRPPETVTDATEDYLEAEDAVAVWMGECCDEDPSAFEPVGELFASWKRWAEEAGEYVGSKKRLGQELEDRGFERDRIGGASTRGFKGLRLLVRASDDRRRP